MFASACLLCYVADAHYFTRIVKKKKPNSFLASVCENLFNSFSVIRVLEENTNLQSILQDIAMPSVTHGTLRISGFGEVTAEEFIFIRIFIQILTLNLTRALS